MGLQIGSSMLGVDLGACGSYVEVFFSVAEFYFQCTIASKSVAYRRLTALYIFEVLFFRFGRSHGKKGSNGDGNSAKAWELCQL